MSKADEPQIRIVDRTLIDSKPIGVHGTLPPEWDTVFGVASAFWLMVIFIGLIF